MTCLVSLLILFGTKCIVGKIDLYFFNIKNMELVDAIRKKDHNLIEELLKKGADINASYNGMTVLNHSIVGIDEKTLSLLLEHGADPNIPTIDGYLPLYFLADHNQCNCVELLLKYKANPNIWMHGKSLLSHVVDRYHTIMKMVKLLLSYGANPNIIDYKYGQIKAPILYAIYHHDIDILELLLKHGADPNFSYISDNRARNILLDAIECFRLDKVLLLIKYRVKLELNGIYILFYVQKTLWKYIDPLIIKALQDYGDLLKKIEILKQLTEEEDSQFYKYRFQREILEEIIAYLWCRND